MAVSDRGKNMTEIQIKNLLRQRGVTQSDVARTLNVSSQTVGRVISGKDKSRRIASTIAKFLNVPVDTLWPGKYPTHYKRQSSAQALLALQRAAASLQAA